MFSTHSSIDHRKLRRKGLQLPAACTRTDSRAVGYIRDLVIIALYKSTLYLTLPYNGAKSSFTLFSGLKVEKEPKVLLGHIEYTRCRLLQSMNLPFVSLSRGLAMQKQLNRSTSRLGWRLNTTQETLYKMGVSVSPR